MSTQRVRDIVRFYRIIDQLEPAIWGTRSIAQHGVNFSQLPRRGVYFFQEPGEIRGNTGTGPRCVRIGTHALTSASKSTLEKRLRQHMGSSNTAARNHRTSVFRKHIGASLAQKEGIDCPSWGKRDAVARSLRSSEIQLEEDVSSVIRQMPFLWLKVDDAAGPQSLRAYIERNAIALLSNFGRTPVDPASENWLGLECNRPKIRQSGLWNSRHVDEEYDPGFLDELDRLTAEAHQ